MSGCSALYSGDDHPWRLTRSQGETDYEFLDAVLFSQDSAEISVQAQHIIADLAAEVRNDHDAHLMVDGYTDTSGRAEHNLELSRMRAGAVAEALARSGILRSRIEIHGFGETHLALPTPDQTPERRNRRVVIRVLNPAS